MNVVRTFNYNDGLETAARLLDKEGVRAIGLIIQSRKDNKSEEFITTLAGFRDYAYKMAAEIRKEFRDDVPPPFKVA